MENEFFFVFFNFTAQTGNLKVARRSCCHLARHFNFPLTRGDASFCNEQIETVVRAAGLRRIDPAQLAAVVAREKKRSGEPTRNRSLVAVLFSCGARRPSSPRKESNHNARRGCRAADVQPERTRDEPSFSQVTAAAKLDDRHFS